jgi:hypothetical protein
MNKTSVQRHLCPYCEDYDTAGHNYCRMCGSHLTAGKPRSGEVHARYSAVEKYCGYCGKQRDKCGGVHGHSSSGTP